MHMSRKTVIIGGVAGGATTAARLRRRVEDMEIILIEKGDNISYAKLRSAILHRRNNK